MADASIVIRAHLRGERELNKARRKLTEIGLAAQAADKRIAGLGSNSNKLGDTITKSTAKFQKHFDGLDKMVQMFGKSMMKMFTMTSKLVVGEMALMGAAMVGFHALLVTGRGLVKLYHGAMQLLAGGAAAATVAIAAVAAAIREQQAAMFAYKGLNYGYKELGSNTRMVSSVMRSLTRDADLATVGVENLNAAFAAVSQRSTFTEGSRQLLKGLMDFASAGQPLEQGVKAAGELIGLLQDPKANFNEIKSSAEALGPAMKEAIKNAGIGSAEELKKAILSGQLALEGGVSGQFSAINDTLISRFKKHFTIIREEFADLGDVFLGPLKDSLEEVARNFRVTFMRIRGEVIRFGQGPMQDGIVGTMEKMNDLMVKLVREYLPKVYGMFDRMGEWWNKVSVGWKMMVNGMKPFVEGARVVEKMFKAFAGPVWDVIKGAFRDFNTILTINEEQFVRFGEQLGGVLAGFIEFGHTLKQIFIEALPFINNILEGVKQMIGFLTSSLQTLRGVIGGLGTDGFGAFLTFAGALVGFSKMKNTKGGYSNAVQKVGAMSVQAANVTVTGLTGPGQMYQGVNPPPLVGPAGGAGGAVGMPSAISRGNSTQQMAAQIKRANPGMSSQQALAAARGGYMTGAGGAYLGTGRGAFSLYRNLRNGPAGMSRMQALKYMQTTPVQYNPGANGPAGFGRLGVGVRNARAGAFGQAASKFGSSMTGRIGAGIGLNLAAGFMPEEAQGAMALGSSLAMINPFLGAAVGLGGAAMNSRTAGGGALTGAGAGAAIGTMIAPGVGTVIGGIIGAVGGGIMGHFGKAKAEKKAARAAATEFASQITGSVMGGIKDILIESGAGGLTIANIKEKTGIGILEEQRAAIGTALKGNEDLMKAAVTDLYKQQKALGIEMETPLEDALKRPKEFLETFVSESDPKLEAFSFVLDKANSRLEYLTRKFRMEDEAVLELADSIGVNLFDATADFDEQVRKLANAMVSTALDMDAAFADLLGNQMGELGRAKAAAAAPRIMDESARALREKVLGGTSTNEDIFTFFEEQMGGLVDLFGGDSFKAAEAFNRLYGAQGEAFSQAGGQLEGMGGAFGSTEVQTFLRNFGTSFTESLATTPRAMLENALAGRGLEFAGDTSALGTATAYQAGRIQDLVGREDFATMSAESIERALQDIGFSNATLQNMTTPMAAAAEDLADVAGRLEQPLIDFKNSVGQIVAALGGDTSRPVYGALSQTMAKHNQIDSMVGGNRTITSGYRNFNLGSANSDHVNGRALDLVGSNLGSYANAMNASGGFAEFHGAGKARHLHTVPGPMGDTNGPVGGGSTVNNFTFNVTGGPNASAQDVAQLVMAEVRRVEQNAKERR